MAPGFMKKTMVYLGLLDDEYDDYDDYDDRSPRGFSAPSRIETRMPAGSSYEEPVDRGIERPGPVPVAQSAVPGRIRTLPRESAPTTASPAVVTPRPSSPSVRPMSVADATKVQVVAPTRFGDAKDIADCLKANRPVIVNLQVAERDLQRRMIDFCSGVTYALSGEMEKVADEVFLLTPTNVKVSDEERQRLQERGFGRS